MTSNVFTELENEQNVPVRYLINQPGLSGGFSGEQDTRLVFRQGAGQDYRASDMALAIVYRTLAASQTGQAAILHREP